MTYPTLGLFIAGEWRGHGRELRPIVNPATLEVIAELPMATDADLDDAVAAADESFQHWRSTSAFERYGVLRRAAELLRERATEIGIATTLEQGKPVGEATAEVR